MAVVWLDPALTLGDLVKEQGGPAGDVFTVRAFVDECLKELQRWGPVKAVTSDRTALRVRPAKGDVLVYFSGPMGAGSVSATVAGLFNRAMELGVTLQPVAMEPRWTTSPAKSSTQAIDVARRLKGRTLHQSQATSVAVEVARELGALAFPNSVLVPKHFFISYTSSDGTELAQSLFEALSGERWQCRPFLAPTSIPEGGDWVCKIKEKLAAVDVMILLDTPQACLAPYVVREIWEALAHGTPILWVQAGAAADGAAWDLTSVRPGIKPHMAATGGRVSDEAVAELLEQAFHLFADADVNRVAGYLGRFAGWASAKKLHWKNVAPDQMVYTVEYPRATERYPERPTRHLIQFYLRRPTAEDKQVARERLKSRVKKAFDATLLLTPAEEQPKEAHPGLVVDRVAEYVHYAAQRVRENPRPRVPGGVILSCSFPECDPEYEQRLMDAVMTFAEEVLERGGMVIFGGPPSFHPGLLERARKHNPTHGPKVLRLYQAEALVQNRDHIEQCRQHAEVVVVKDHAGGDRDAALRLMREQMVNDDQARALIALGGKTHASRKAPGLQEEIQLALARKLPCAVIGSAGGFAAQITADPWEAGLTGYPCADLFTPDERLKLLTSLDFRSLADLVLSKLFPAAEEASL